VNVGGLAGATRSSYYVGATVATPVTGLRAGAAFDYLDIHSQNNDTWSLAGYLSFQATEKLSFHARVEYFNDKPDMTGSTPAAPAQGVLFNDLAFQRKAEVLALTGTVQYDLWKNVISRLEVRWDNSLDGNNLFGGGAPGAGILGLPVGNVTPDAQNAFMVALNVIYKF
jgi:hypothetical protein